MSMLDNLGEERLSRMTKSKRVSHELESMARELGSGERLPSVRSLCASLGISLATLNSAMRSLEARGVIERRHGSGVYVTDKISVKRIAVVINSGFLLAGGSPVWGMLVGEMIAGALGSEAEVAVFLAQSDAGVDLPTSVPSDMTYAIARGRVDSVVAIGLGMEAVWELEAAGLPVIAFSGPGSWMFRFNLVDMAVELSRQYVDEGCKTAMVAGCSRRTQWEQLREPIESVGLEVVRVDELHWHEGSLASRMTQPFLHLGQDFAIRFEEVAKGPEKPDVLFLMDDIFAHGFLMVWRNSPFRDSVQLASHSNRELRMYMGWEGRLGLMEIEVLPLARVLLTAALIAANEPRESGAGWTSQLSEQVAGLEFESVMEDERLVTKLRWHAHFLSHDVLNG